MVSAEVTPFPQPDVLHPVANKANVAVQLDGVLKRFGDAIALHKISLTIEEGEFITLLGPSGCGKTTLLNLMAGFAEADGGEIFIDGDLVTEIPPYQREIGIVFQNYALFPHMTVEKNVGYGLRMRGVPKAEIAERVEQALALVKLAGYGQRKPRELSGGQQQRVALARALVIRPKVLLLDEPFSALDKNLRLSMQVELKAIQRKLGVTTVFVTHDQGEALSMSDRVVVMSAGHVRQIGTPDDIYRRPQDPFVAGFVGDVNILPGHYAGRDSTAVIELGGNKLRLPSERVNAHVGERLDVYMRPENLQLAPLSPHSLFSATVITHVFQGDHVDVHLDAPALGSAALFARQSGLESLTRWPVGSVVGVSVDDEGVCAFSAAKQG
ncbi:ABC transporter ATP-binding protein [Pantoea sp. EABMAA-21]|uniref:ABC transporter ATP-binding protein n=2 Tax=Pantoea TaxID=53335 RepID=UPI000BD85354|nr:MULTISPECIES: ABC transporter ATP-binding protein [unclassified Pantoea]MDI9277096.1 ABC transporter ATP-binding protein [Pantoea sp. EABMAA-21]MXP54401.1 ABC transporter ATP-binding protein [Pantoea sp. Seng]SNY74412.1 putative spermidine/putrescine transport system ATP-binding protein [Pantoea sp. GL120224-02]